MKTKNVVLSAIIGALYFVLTVVYAVGAIENVGFGGTGAWGVSLMRIVVVDVKSRLGIVRNVFIGSGDIEKYE